MENDLFEMTLPYTLSMTSLAASIPKHLRHSRPQHSLSSACPEFQHLSENKLTKFHIRLFEVTWSTEAPIPNHPKSSQLFRLRLLRLWDPPRNDVSEPHVTTKSWHPQRKPAKENVPSSQCRSSSAVIRLSGSSASKGRHHRTSGNLQTLPLPPWHKFFWKLGKSHLIRIPRASCPANLQSVSFT